MDRVSQNIVGWAAIGLAVAVPFGARYAEAADLWLSDTPGIESPAPIGGLVVESTAYAEIVLRAVDRD